MKRKTVKLTESKINRIVRSPYIEFSMKLGIHLKDSICSEDCIKEVLRSDLSPTTEHGTTPLKKDAT